jgi:hypothetical protein
MVTDDVLWDFLDCARGSWRNCNWIREGDEDYRGEEEEDEFATTVARFAWDWVGKQPPLRGATRW